MLLFEGYGQRTKSPGLEELEGSTVRLLITDCHSMLLRYLDCRRHLDVFMILAPNLLNNNNNKFISSRQVLSTYLEL